MALATGDKLGPYEILGPLGAGGMGEVYKARDTRLDRTVAMKVLPEHIAQRDDLRARFEREARAVASLNHPNICTLHDIGPGYMVMELIEGETLAARIEKGALPLDQALKLAAQIADALDRAHRAGVTHRDVKPQNIMLTRDGVKVLDFGLAKSGSKPGPTEATLTKVLTTEGTIMGTPQYMAPEQFEGKEADARSDIWAFGAVLYEMVTGQKAFQGKSYSSLVGAILSADPAPMAVKPFTPAWLERLVRRCLAKDPEERYFSMHDIVLELRTPPQESAVAGPSTAARWPSAIACAAILAVAGWTWFHRPATPAPSAAYNLEVSPPDGESLYQDAGSGIQAISPDGRALAFIAGSKGARRIWVRPLDAPVARSFAGTELADGLFWSPDSRHLGFMAGNRLNRIDLATGAVKEICDGGSSLRGASWSAAGVILFGSAASPLQRVSPDGGTPVHALSYDRNAEAGQNFPQFLPDGKQFLYWSRGITGGQTGVFVGTLDQPPDRQPRKKVLESPFRAIYTGVTEASNGYLLFRRGRTVFAQPFDLKSLTLTGSPRPVADNIGARGPLGQFSVSENGILAAVSAGDMYRTVSIVSKDGETLSTVGKSDAYSAMRLSPDGRSLALVKAMLEGPIEIWLMDLAHGSPVPFTRNARTNVHPVWSPQSDELLFSVFRDGGYQMYRKKLSESSTEELVRTDADSGRDPAVGSTQHLQIRSGQLAGDWTRDPPRIVYIDRPAGPTSWKIAALPLVPGGKPVLIEDTGIVKFGPRVSPSGRWVAYASDESGGFEIYVRSMPNRGKPAGPRIRISTGGGANAAWSADGRTLFYNSPDDRLLSVPLKVDGDRLEAGEPKAMFALGGSSSYNGAAYWEPIGNGERFVVLRSTQVTGRDNRINILVNWQAGLD